MGWLSSLAKIGGAVAAPFTGGASLALSALGSLGDVASSASKGRAEGRQAEADYLLNRDRLAFDRTAQARNDTFKGANLDIDRRDQASTLDNANLSRAIRLGILGSNPNIEAPAHIASRMGKFTDIGPQGVMGREDIIAALRPRVLESLEKGQQYAPLTLEDLPQLSTPPQPGKTDSVLNWLGTIGTIGGALAPKKPIIPTARP